MMTKPMARRKVEGRKAQFPEPLPHASCGAMVALQMHNHPWSGTGSSRFLFPDILQTLPPFCDLQSLVSTKQGTDQAAVGAFLI